jgi:hypothetical protein
MGRYIAHKRRKIKGTSEARGSDDAVAAGLRAQLLALQRAAERLELERARVVKQARLIERRLERQDSVVDRTSGRRRTAARAAGYALISATAGMRTLCISIERDPRANPDDLWSVDVRIEGEEAQGYRVKDPTIPASEDAIHLMRALAPRIAEEFVLGRATPGADTNNSNTASILAECYMQKTRSVLTLNEDEKKQVKCGIVAESERTVLLRLKYFQYELNAMIENLMNATFLNRKKCDAALQRIYAGFQDFSNGQMESVNVSFDA